MTKSWEERITEAVKIWSKEGRTEEQIYGVHNFLTGKGWQVIAKEIDEAREEAFQEVARNTTVESITQAERQRILEKVRGRIGLLRQWLNEDRITDPEKMVTNEQIKDWLELLTDNDDR